MVGTEVKGSERQAYLLPAAIEKTTISTKNAQCDRVRYTQYDYRHV